MINTTDFAKFDIHIPINPKTNGNGDVYIKCPKCSHTRESSRKNEACLGVNLNTGIWGCNHCHWSGNVKQRIHQREFKPLTVTPVYSESDDIRRYLLTKRGISRETLDKLKISIGECNIRQTKNKNKDFLGKIQYKTCIAFNYFYNEELINVKYRDLYKNFALISGADKPMYNIDSIKNSEECLITEGEFDVAAWQEAGYDFAISVPNGTTLSDSEKKYFKETGKFKQENQLNLEYIDKHWTDFLDKKVIYLGTDTDAPGLKLMEELSRRLGRKRCKKIRYDWYLNKITNEPCKDANDVLVSHGREALLECKKKAEEYTIDGIIRVNDVREDLLIEFDSGLVKGSPTGFISLNNHFNWMLGDPIWVNGFPAGGKSSFILNLLLSAAILYKWKFALHCPENYPVKRLVRIMVEILVGNTCDLKMPDRMSKMEYVTAMDFIQEYFIFIDNIQDGKAKRYTPMEILEIAGDLVAKKGIVGVFQDPWKSLKHAYGKEGRDTYLENILAEEVSFATANNLLNIIAHHPPTPERVKDKIYNAPSAFELVGGQIWYASGYEQLCVHRQISDDVKNTYTEIHVQKVKDHKLVGFPTEGKPVLLKFRRKTNQFLEERGGNYVSPFEGFIQNILNINNKNLEFEIF